MPLSAASQGKDSRQGSRSNASAGSKKPARRGRRQEDPQRARAFDRQGQRPRHHGPQRFGQVDPRACARRQGRLRRHPGRGAARRRGHSRPGARRARRQGTFLAFQYPLEIPGVATMTFLRTALNAQRKTRGEPELLVPEFMKRVNEVSGKLGIDKDMLRRGVNVGFSGGEKKRNEILQMALLEPRLCVLDETDSGLDIDALKVVSDGVNRLRSPDRAFVVITHYQRLLDYIVPDVVHVLSKGRIVKTGDKALALELEATGYAQYRDEAA